MLTHHRKPVCLSLISFDLPIWTVVETSATVYQKDRDRYHILLTEPSISEAKEFEQSPLSPGMPRLLWLEISPYRVIMTMQGNGNLSYRHYWEQGIYGVSRFWLQSEMAIGTNQMRLRNYTRSLKLEGTPLPHHLRVEYELWSQQVQLGRYVLNLEIHH